MSKYFFNATFALVLCFPMWVFWCLDIDEEGAAGTYEQHTETSFNEEGTAGTHEQQVENEDEGSIAGKYVEPLYN